MTIVNIFSNLLTLALAILVIVGEWGIFEKMGEEGWKSLIPFYGEYILFKHIWNKKMFWISFAIGMLSIPAFITCGLAVLGGYSSLTVISLIVCTVFIVAMVIINLMALYKLAKAFGQGAAFTVGLVLISGVFYMILGFGKYEYARA